MTYGGSVPALTYTYTGLVKGDRSESFTGGLTTTATSSSNVGTYPITEGSLAATGNYTIGTFNEGTLTINPAALTVTADSTSMTYGGSVPALTFTYTGLVNGDSSASLTGSLTTTGTSSSNVGTYPITEGSLAATGNYTIGTFNQGSLTVNPAALTVTADSTSMTYGGSVPGLTFTYIGLVNGDSSASFTGSLTTNATSSSSVGTYITTEGSLAATGNYTIGTFNQGALTVNPAALTVTADSKSMIYGGSVLGLTFTYIGLVNGDSSASFTGSPTTTATSSSSVGNYFITEGSLAATGNYTIGTFNEGTLTINPAALTVTADSTSMTYGGSVPGLTFTYTGLVNGDSSASFAGGLTTNATSSSSVSNYFITEGSLAATGNYTIGTFNEGTLTINPAALTVTADSTSMTYGGSVPALTFTYTGLVNGDSSASLTVSLTTTATSSSSVGTYIITEGSLAATGNYTIGTFNEGTLTINLAALTVTASNKSMTYGGSVPVLSYTYTGLVNGDTSASFSGVLSTSATSSSSVGTYAISEGTLAATGNYTIGTFNQGTLTVTPFAFTYQIANDTQTYGAAANMSHDLGTTINTNVNGENLDIAYSSTGDTATAAAGTYPITGTLSNGTGQLSDYNVTLLPGTLTVTMGVGSGVSAIILLSPTASGALTLSGNAQLTVTGVVDVDSSSSSALTASGNATVSANNINVVGKTQISGNAHLNPSAVTGASPVADPLVNLPVPNVGGTATSVNLSGQNTLTINPGIYSQIKVSGNAVLTMNSGVYVIAGGGFSVSGNGIVNGSGVMIYNGGSKYANGVDAGTYGALDFSGNTQLNLTPLTSGTYQNILIFQGRQNANTISFSGNADPSAASIIYAPAAAVTLSGNGQVGSAAFQATVVASTLNLNGNAIFQLSNPGDGATAFSPGQIRTAYGVNALSLDGTGQTVAIVDAFDNPSIYQSVDAFDNQFGTTADGLSLFQQYGPGSSFLTVLNQDGQAGNLPATDPSGAGAVNWEIEEALDVEWTHAMAPGAQIILVEASSQSLPDLMSAVATAAAQPGVSVVSMSWGFPESYAGLASAQAQYDSYFTTPAGHQGVTFVASTGDYGSAVPEYPAFSPNVVAIGGTSLALNADGSYNNETGWGYYANQLGKFIGSGGGVSQYEAEPAYQQGVQSTGGRTIPDVSFVADPGTGAWIADPFNLPGSNPWEIAGGTSLSAPAWAGLIALVDQGRTAAGEQTLGSAGATETQTALYNLPQSDFNVIVSGTNGDFTATRL